jgi:aminoglycoside phosphotransferase (APT) family kinase protein
LLQRSLQRDTSTSLQLHDAARALAQFHSLPQSSAPQIIDSSEGDIIATSSLVYAVFPSAADRVAGIGSSIVEQLHNSSASTPCLIHGDAHLGNFFPLIDGRIGIIDLDTTVVGPAEWDLASFFGFKIWIAMRERCDVELVLSTFPSFVGAYNESTVNPVSLSRACIVLAQKMLTERISRGICRGKITGLHELNTFLDVAERCLVMAGAHDA